MEHDHLVAIQAISDTLYRYCRALDRMDRDLYGRVFVPGASLDYGEHFIGTAEQFADWVWTAHEAMQGHSHQIANVLAEIADDGTSAVSEAYVTVCLRTLPDAEGGVVDFVDRGRYLDRWTLHEGQWRIGSRLFRSDIQQVLDAGLSPPATAIRDRTDPSYELFA